MKKSIRNVFKALVLLSIGWTIGYIRLPEIQIESTFWLGFSIAGVLFFFVFLNFPLLKRRSNSFPKVAFIVIALLLLVIGLQFLEIKKNEYEHVMKLSEIDELKSLVEFEKQMRLSPLIDHLVASLNQLENNESKQIDNASIAKFKALDNYFIPFEYKENRTLLEQKVSPERGYLLLSLLNSDLDSTSLSKVIGEISFEGSSLRNADLSGYDLRNINLDGSDLQGADLSYTLLRGASLQGVNFSNANLSNTCIDSSILNRSNAQWAILSGASLVGSQLEGCSWSFAVLDSAVLSGATIKNTNLEGAILSYSDWDSALLYFDTLTSAKLAGANFMVKKLRRSLIENLEMDSTYVNTFWIEKENPSKLMGLDLFLKKHQLYVNGNGDSLMIMR